MAHSVAITGMGVVCALGNDTRSVWKALSEGRSALEPTEKEAYGDVLRFPAAVAHDFVPEAHFTPQELMLRDRYAQFAQVAARQAMHDAGLDLDGRPSDETAVILGTGGGGEQTREMTARRLFGERKPRVNPMLVPKTNAQAAVGLISSEYGITGPSFSVSTGCASANHAMALAFDMVRNGVVRRAITGGSEASVLYTAMKAFHAVRAMSTTTCRPFSRDRDGMALGEGAGILVFENLADAWARGAHVHAVVAGWGMSADAGDPVHPTVRGPATAMAAALHDAGLNPEDVGYVNAHGTGTVVNDRIESEALRRVFGAHANNLWISSTKSMHGHLFGGTGGVEMIVTALALEYGVVPPTANYLGPDPECDLDYVPNTGRSRRFAAAMTNAFAFGGLNAVLVLRRA